MVSCSLLSRLDIQKDENEALKVALQSTVQAKEEDLRRYMDMFAETKKIFLHGIQRVRSANRSRPPAIASTPD